MVQFDRSMCGNAQVGNAGKHKQTVAIRQSEPLEVKEVLWDNYKAPWR